MPRLALPLAANFQNQPSSLQTLPDWTFPPDSGNLQNLQNFKNWKTRRPPICQMANRAESTLWRNIEATNLLTSAMKTWSVLTLDIWQVMSLKQFSYMVVKKFQHIHYVNLKMLSPGNQTKSLLSHLFSWISSMQSSFQVQWLFKIMQAPQQKVMSF